MLCTHLAISLEAGSGEMMKSQRLVRQILGVFIAALLLFSLPSGAGAFQGHGGWGGGGWGGGNRGGWGGDRGGWSGDRGGWSGNRGYYAGWRGPGYRGWGPWGFYPFWGSYRWWWWGPAWFPYWWGPPVGLYWSLYWAPWYYPIAPFSRAYYYDYYDPLYQSYAYDNAPVGRPAVNYPVGTVLSAAEFQALAPSRYPIAVKGMVYYKCGETWFLEATSGGANVYIVVNPPPGP